MERKLFWKVYRKSGDEKSPRTFAKLVGYRFPLSDREEESQRPDKLKEVLTDHEKKLLNTAIYDTWCQIASDMENNAHIGNFKLTNLVAVETCLDADHLTLDGLRYGKEADEIVHRLVMQFDYSPVLLYICSFVHLR